MEFNMRRNRLGRLSTSTLKEMAGFGVASLPCLYRNNCTEIYQRISLEEATRLASELSTKLRKSASGLAWNVEYFCEKYGIEKVGFLTLTFKDHVTDFREAQKRFHSLKTHILKSRYCDYIRVVERQKSGRIHYHLLVALTCDIRTGFDFSAVKDNDYSSANQAIRAEWAFWRRTAPKYRFGRTELMPVRSTSEGIGKYVGKYIGKTLEMRKPEDKGCRLVEYSRGARMASTRFQFVSEGSAEWRRKLGIFVHYISENTGCDPTFEGLRRVLGVRWSYHWREFIFNLP
ncbi:hypothetical protein OIK79_005184 [Salmonella enterica]|nr:hypothetical protein [Salmonella enterica]